MRTCGPDKASKKDRKAQINIEICGFVSIPKGVGLGDIRYTVPPLSPSPVPHQMTPMVDSTEVQI